MHRAFGLSPNFHNTQQYFSQLNIKLYVFIAPGGLSNLR